MATTSPDSPLILPTAPLLNPGATRDAVCKGPVTRARQTRAMAAYLVLAALGLVPWTLDAAAPWQAAGAGLWVPGGGFLVDGGWAVLLLPITLALFVLAMIAWFWAGM